MPDTAALEADALVGRTFGEFVIRERLGSGAFGAVYRADQPALAREAVVKLLHPSLRGREDVKTRFLREARLASQLDHPFAAHIYAFGAEPDGEMWIAMEFIRGAPLDELLEKGPLPLARAVPLIEAICEVVHSAHEQGIVHRDIKPANVMVVERSGRQLPKLLDFGLAKTLEPESVDTGAGSDRFADALAQPVTMMGAVIGSPHYMAPEIWKKPAGADARSDQYAIAVLAYHVLAGRLPFEGKTLFEVFSAHQARPVAPVGGEVPAELDAVLSRALDPSPEARFPNVLAFAGALRESCGAHPLEKLRPTGEQPVKPAPSLPPAPPPRRSWLPVALGLAAVVGVGAGTVLAVSNGSPEPAPAAHAPEVRAPLVHAAANAPPPRVEPPAPVAPAAPPPAPAPAPAPRVVKLTSYPPGAEVYDAQLQTRLGTAPMMLELPAGAPATLDFRLGGYSHITRTVAADDTELAVKLFPVKRTGAPVRRSAVIKSNPY